MKLIKLVTTSGDLRPYHSKKKNLNITPNSNFSIFLLSIILTLSSFINGQAQSISEKTLMGYWHNWGPEYRLTDIPADYNLIVIAFALTSDNLGTVTFTPSYDITTFKQDILTVQGQGRKVIISIGGGTGTVLLPTTQDKDNFVTTVKAIVEEYNFDGIDIDFEGESIAELGDVDYMNPTNLYTINFNTAIDELIAYFGSDFLLCAAPETYYVQAGYEGILAADWDPEEKLKGSFLPFLYHFHDRINYLAVQLYNSGGVYMLDNSAYDMGGADFIVGATHMLLAGIPVGGLNQSDLSGLDWLDAFSPEQILIGLPASSSAAPGGGFVTDDIVNQTLDALIQGKTDGLQYQHLSQSYPNIGGMMTWSINWDKDERSYGFANNFTNYLNGLSSLSIENDLEVDFGAIDASRTYSKTYVITNYTDLAETIEITDISDEILIDQTNFIIQPLSSETITLEMQSEVVGTFGGSFTCDFSSKPSEVINIIADVGCFIIRGLEDKFDEGTLSEGWTPTSEISLSIDNDMLNVQAEKVNNVWDNFRYTFDGVDLSQNPTITFNLESAGDLTLRIDLVDANGFATNSSPVSIDYIGGSGEQTFTLNYENKFNQSWPDNQTVDNSTISQIQIYPQPGVVFSGSFTIDNIVIGDPTKVEYNHEDSFCEGSSYDFGSQTLTMEGVYKEVFQNSMGCDSTVNLTLHMLPIYTEDVIKSICDNETYLFGGETLSTSGDFQHIFESTLGCDSTVNLTLTVNPTFIESVNKSICPGEVFTFGAQELSMEGTYQEMFQSTLGCDSLVNLTLGINEVYFEDEDVTICEGTSYSFGTQTLTEGGTFSELFESVSGCDSTVNLTLTVKPNLLNPEVTVTDEVLTVNEENVNYQWVDCTSNTPIPNETGQNFTVSESGNYSVIVTDEFCEAISDCVSLEIVLGIENDISKEMLTVYPIPTDSKITVHLGTKRISGIYQISNVNGAKVKEGKIINQNEITLDLPNELGVYFLKVADEKGNSSTTRIIKK